MEHYVTLFDIGFAPQGIALHRSLQRHSGRHTLWVLCMDEEVDELLRKLRLPDVQVIRLAEAESDELRRVRPERSRAEYCWTLTPFTFDLVFERAPDAKRATYIDADVWLRDNPQQIFTEFERSSASVQITEHAYSPEYDQTATSGRYCVQFLTMNRDRSSPVRHWWQDRCIEWCFARVEDGKFGDQKYLDDWPERFQDLIHVANPKYWFQGPWNATRFPYSEAVSFHFHSLRLARNGLVRPVSRNYLIPKPHRKHIYEPYLEDLAASIRLIAGATGRAPEPQYTAPAALSRLHPRTLLRTVFRRFRKRAGTARSRKLLRLP